MAKIKMTPNATGEVVKMSERRRDARPGSQAKSPTSPATIRQMPPSLAPAAAVPDPEVEEVMAPALLMLSVVAFTVTVPALPAPEVSEVILPPLRIETLYGAPGLTTMLLAGTSPVVAAVTLPPSTVSCGAVTLSVVCVGAPIGEVASFLIEKVAPLLSVMLLVAVTVTSPVCPEEPLAAAALMLLFLPSTVSVPAFTVTTPALPVVAVPEVTPGLKAVELIVPPL